MVFSILRQKGAGRRWRERWLSKINLNWGKHCYCCWFGQKWPSNRIKYDSRIFEHPQDCSSSDPERGFGEEKVVCIFCATLLDTWAKGRSSHILPSHYRNGRCRQTFFNKIITGDWDLVFCLWPLNNATEFWMGWWDIPLAEETEIPKVPHQDHVDKFFRLSRHSAQIIHTRGKNSKCKILQRSNGSPSEAHSAGSSSYVLLSRFVLVVQ